MKLATVGTSFITDVFINALKAEGSFELNAVYSRTIEQGQQFADKHGVKKVITDWQTLLDDPEIEVVYIASPNDLHYSQSKQVLLAHKHVICEKPFVANHKEYVDLIQTVKQTNYFCFDAITVLHLPNLQVLKDHLNQIGNVKLMTSAMTQYSSRYDLLLKGQTPNIFDPNHAGGALMDLGVYPLSLCVALFKEPIDIVYHANCHSNGIDLSGSLTLIYPQMIATFIIGKDCAGTNFTSISGEKGSLFIPMHPSRFTEVQLKIGQNTQQIGIEAHPDAMVHEIKDFAQILQFQDWNRYWEDMAVTEIVVKLMEKARLQIGLRFSSDQ